MENTNVISPTQWQLIEIRRIQTTIMNYLQSNTWATIDELRSITSHFETPIDWALWDLREKGVVEQRASEMKHGDTCYRLNRIKLATPPQPQNRP